MDTHDLIAETENNVFFRCVEDCNEAIMITSVTGKLVYVNPAWRRIYGYTSDEAIGNAPRILHSGYHNGEFYGQMWRQILDPNHGFWKGEVTNRAKDGTLIPVLLTITSVRNHHNDVIGHMGIALDNSAQKDLEAKILQADRLASIGILASGLAHEVGTPLGVVRGRAELLMMRASTSGDASLSKGLEVIVTQIDRISRLIDSLLRFSRAGDDVRREAVKVADVVSEVMNLIDQNMRAGEIELKMRVPAGFSVTGDFNRLQQIFLNLMVNSIHAIEDARKKGRLQGHSIEIRAKRIVTKQGERAAIEVRDSGCGIQRENMRKLFQPFFTTKDVGQGTGLGLAIVSKLLQEMGGEISVESKVGEGTSFTIRLSPA